MSAAVKACKAKLKICGMREPANINAVAQLQPDYMGFLMYPGSKRFIADLDPAVVKAVPAAIKTTGVFVDEEPGAVIKAIEIYGFKAVQLHGTESPEYCRQLKEAPDAGNEVNNFEIIKAFGIDETFDFSILSAYENVVDYFLFDTQTAEHGGSGKSFNWRLLESYILNKPYFLSGGIGLENAPQLQQIEDNRFYAMDVNSRFELSPALKDIGKLNEFKKLLGC
ncbi:phosphoribosylanthranilate isomerase [Pedobacter westerhofensis]|uniref:N-(5'-phosphoribosyl)anthranilate isomerase n=1 Tax=Pedobacter westerhofensis TaxID=425512 RepID=A0A521E881_9SPHI|nr:phosphoribosylanthranilate isomerase [Pedobacter westerhofensis]SMO80165.1 phosphoribosylanthranilate isomerase [Pedobacter westerhofensis]